MRTVRRLGSRRRAIRPVDSRALQSGRLECLGLLATTVVVLLGLWLTYRQETAPFAEVSAGVARGTVLDASQLRSINDLAPIVTAFPSSVERDEAARVIFDWIQAHGRLTHVGDLSAVTVPAAEILADPQLAVLNERLKAHANAREIGLLTPADLASLKPLIIVRSPEAYRRQFAVTVTVFVLGFWFAHVLRRAFHATGDPTLLPILLLLTGLSLMGMMSSRDALRDTDVATSVAFGVAMACVLLAGLCFIDFENPRFRLSTLVPLSAAVTLAAILLAFGDGPGESGVKVRVFGFQPVEPIRLFAVFALASYFSRRWEFLREISRSVGPSIAIRRFIRLPRWRDVRPLGAIVGTLIVFFFLQRDLGPALVLGCLSLALYGIARGRMPLVLLGFSTLLCGFAVGYWLGVPATLAHRVAIWLDPWNNGLSRGDQIAHALWGLASGGTWGVGLGVGDGRLIPAGDTDLIVAVLGEDLGFVGLMAVAGLYGLLIWRMLRIAARAPGNYTAFLGLGLALSLAVPTIVIVGGLLGLLPLSGVATPFLSYGKSSMICNFAAVAIVLAIARRTGPPRPVFARQVRTVSWALFAVATVLVARTAVVQTWQADAVALRPNLGRQADGALRFQYNPRLLIAAGMIRRGTIYDRNGFALATSNSDETQPFLDRLAALEVAPIDGCAPAPARCYPLGGRAFHLLGDSSRQTNWSAHNASFVERDSNAFLQGFDDHAQTVQVTLGDGSTQMAVLRDYRELLPLVRNKGDANNAAARGLLDKQRDIHLTLDGPLQVLVASALEARVREAGVTHGAAVVMDAATGAVLASASYPWPTLRRPDGSSGAADSDQLLDRARYGLYPPGSTFKLVTACAALNASLANENTTFSCERLPDGRVGAHVKGIGTLRDDLLDAAPHGRIDLLRALVISCNAYFGQLAVRIGAKGLSDAAAAARIQVSSQPTINSLRRYLPFAGYGQGEVIASPIRMARVAAAIAGDGTIHEPPLLQGERNPQSEQRLVSAAGAAFLRGAMRQVVTSGTGRVLAGEKIPIAGKTGTAELNGAPSHSWFVGFAPYGTETRQIAFAVIVENAGYGSRVAAPLAGDIVKAALMTGLIR